MGQKVPTLISPKDINVFSFGLSFYWCLKHSALLQFIYSPVSKRIPYGVVVLKGERRGSGCDHLGWMIEGLWLAIGGAE